MAGEDLLDEGVEGGVVAVAVAEGAQGEVGLALEVFDLHLIIVFKF